MKIEQAVFGFPSRVPENQDHRAMQLASAHPHRYMYTSLMGVRWYAVEKADIPDEILTVCTPELMKVIRNGESVLYIETGNSADVKVKRFMNGGK